MWGHGQVIQRLYPFLENLLIWPRFGHAESDIAAMLRRYLAAFGPASVMDFQAWSGLTGLKKVIDPLKDDLVIYEDENGTELLDLPEMPLPSGDTPAPMRFMPEYDNLLISYKDRSRVIADVYKKRVLLTAGRVASTILVDGFVAGTWKADRNGKTAILRISPFEPLEDTSKQALINEGENLIRFVDEDAEDYVVEFV